MAKVRNNVVVRGLTGSFGDQMVLKTDKAGRTIVTNKPGFNPNRQFSPEQKAHQAAFQDAAAYGKGAKGQLVYVDLAKGTPLSPYNVAVADWFNVPEILELDLSAWHGAVGQVIRIRARDDVQVTQVHVAISDGSGALLEQGQAVRAEGEWWNYTTSAAAPGDPRVVVTARDLPGHVAEMRLTATP